VCVCVCVCGLCCSACNVHAPYCHLWPAPFYNSFSVYLVNGTIFGKKVTAQKCVLISSTKFVKNIFHSVKNLGRYEQKCILFFMLSTLCSCQILIKLEFSRQVLQKYWNIQFHENLSSVSRVSPRGRTDMTKLIVAFRNFANAPIKREVY
jgi:hypothetical protein